MKAAKELLKKGKKGERKKTIPFKFQPLNLFEFSHNYSVAGNVFLDYLSPKSKVDVFMLLISACRITSSGNGIRLQNLITMSSLLTAMWKARPFCLKGTAEKSANPSFAHALPLLPVRGFWEFLPFLNLFYFIYLIFRCSVFSIHYKIFQELDSENMIKYKLVNISMGKFVQSVKFSSILVSIVKSININFFTYIYIMFRQAGFRHEGRYNDCVGFD